MNGPKAALCTYSEILTAAEVRALPNFSPAAPGNQ